MVGTPFEARYISAPPPPAEEEEEDEAAAAAVDTEMRPEGPEPADTGDVMLEFLCPDLGPMRLRTPIRPWSCS